MIGVISFKKGLFVQQRHLHILPGAGGHCCLPFVHLLADGVSQLLLELLALVVVLEARQLLTRGVESNDRPVEVEEITLQRLACLGDNSTGFDTVLFLESKHISILRCELSA
jgi:hypothetical protein